MLYSGLLNTTCTIFRQTALYDPALTEYGEIDMVWETLYTGVVCRLDVGSVPMRQQRGGLVESGSRKLFVEVSVDIQKDDRVQVGSEYFSVVDVLTITGMIDSHHKEATLSLIDGYS